MKIRLSKVALNQHGWSLIELLVTLSILSILIGIAYPSYTQYLLRTHRQQAKAALLETASALEHYYNQHHTYLGATLNKLKLKSSIAQDNYKLSIDSATAKSFQISVAPQGEQAKKDKCNILHLNQLGKLFTDKSQPTCPE